MSKASNVSFIKNYKYVNNSEMFKCIRKQFLKTHNIYYILRFTSKILASSLLLLSNLCFLRSSSTKGTKAETL